MPKNKYLTPRQVSQLLQVKELTVTSWLRRGTLKGQKIGRVWRIPKESLDAFVKPDRSPIMMPWD